MNLYLVLLLSVLSAVHWSYGKDLVEEEVIIPHHMQPLGSWSVVNPSQKDVQEAVRKAVKEFNIKSKKKKYFKLVDVTSAQTKVTNMINYKIEAIIGKTKCLKTEAADLDSCAMAQRRLKCKFGVEFNTQDNEYAVETVVCNK
ncbi:cystatin [Neoarius graeffei]|uniref:cystatin n=1 Tax=Neoarius graeffei TaxID=443677 RepID=UPI00298BD74C|nr:cystatin [Neoarius graeffei]